VTGADRFSIRADFMTMQRIGLMQEVPNTAKREARTVGVQARIERERALLAMTELAVRRDAALAWLAVYFAESRVARLAIWNARTSCCRTRLLRASPPVRHCRPSARWRASTH
jgi:hypothetical protein